MAERLGEAYLELTVRNQKMQAGLLNAHKRSMTFTQQVGSSFKQLGSSMAGSVATGLAAFAGAQKILNEITAGIERAMQLEGLTAAFEGLAGSMAKAEGIASAMNQAFRGTVDEVTMLEQANNAMLLGVASTAKEFQFLASAGRRLGKAVGKDAAFGFESLVVGIGRQSRMMLDNLGIIVDTNKAYEEYAAQLGKTAQELTDAERKQAFMNATMDATREKMSRLGSDIETTGERWSKFKTTWSNVFTAIGTGISKVGGFLYDIVDKTSERMRDLRLDITTPLGFSFDESSAKAIQEANEWIVELERQQAKNELEISRILAERKKREAAIVAQKKKQTEEAEKQLAIEYKAWQDSMTRTQRLEIETLRAQGKEYEATKRQIDLERDQMMERSKSLDETLAIHKWYRAQIAKLNRDTADREKRETEQRDKEEKRNKERKVQEEARQMAEYQQEKTDALKREEEITKSLAAWETKNHNLRVRMLEVSGRKHQAQLYRLELERKKEIEAAHGSVERLKLIEEWYNAEKQAIQLSKERADQEEAAEKARKERERMQKAEWVTAEQLWKRNISLGKSFEERTRTTEPAQDLVDTTETTKGLETKQVELLKQQLDELKELNDKASFTPTYQ